MCELRGGQETVSAVGSMDCLSLVLAATVITVPVAYIKIVAVEKFVVESVCRAVGVTWYVWHVLLVAARVNSGNVRDSSLLNRLFPVSTIVLPAKSIFS